MVDKPSLLCMSLLWTVLQSSDWSSTSGCTLTAQGFGRAVLGKILAENETRCCLLMLHLEPRVGRARSFGIFIVTHKLSEPCARCGLSTPE